MGKYVWPCPGYSRISSGYGNRICPFHGQEFHDGIDLDAASGTPILAFGPGTVTMSGWNGGTATIRGGATVYPFKRRFTPFFPPC